LEHNIVNTGTSPMRLATVYAPPADRPRVVHHTKGDAQRDKSDKPPHIP
jgi:oxalate decarboxylase/phosphoglucose isomerase-like protein (cupin superfamily)